MATRKKGNASSDKRRTTVTLPAASFEQATRIARTRKVSLSTVISEALSAGLRLYTATDRSKAVIESYRTAFKRFTDDEIAILDGVILEPIES